MEFSIKLKAVPVKPEDVVAVEVNIDTANVLDKLSADIYVNGAKVGTLAGLGVKVKPFVEKWLRSLGIPGGG